MKVLNIKELVIPEIKIIRFARFRDDRGYFTEQYRKSDLLENSGVSSLKGQELVQANQSYSRRGVVRGLHFQWNPYMGKLVRTLSGHMVDLILDIRKESPTYGKLIAYDMPTSNDKEYEEWIWIPPGFAHGNFFLEDTMIEYLCTGEYSQNCESGISPFARDIDWSLCDYDLRQKFETARYNAIVSDKDRNAQSLKEWELKEDSNNFMYEELKEKIEKVDEQKILVTGGSGLLGSELKSLIPKALFPTRQEFDLTKKESMEKYFEEHQIELVLHLAAFISPPRIDEDPNKAIETNIIGTSNLVNICSKKNARIIYISTDYVFKGDQGNYSEDDSVFPVNKYAWSKLGGECAVNLYDKGVVIRTSFSQNEFPYDGAFDDQWTSRENVREIAKKINILLNKDVKGTIHLGGHRKTVYEYAKLISPEKEIKKISISQMSFKAPKDTSLNCEKYNNLLGEKSK